MFSNVPNRYGVKSKKTFSETESLERQSSAREEAVADVRNTSEKSPEQKFWIDDHFQQMLKTLVRKVVEAENELYAIQERVKKLQDSKSERKVPSGLKIHRVTAKGKNIQPLQEQFDMILKEAEFKLLDATIEALTHDEQLCRDLCTNEKKNVEAAVRAWRNSFQTSETDLDVDHFVASAECFANDFYFQCVAIRTSKKVARERRKAAKEANRARRMETEFQVNEQSIKDIVARELQKEFSKRHPAVTVSKQFSGKSTISRGQRKSSRSSSRNGNPSKTGRGAKAATPQKDEVAREPESHKRRVNKASRSLIAAPNLSGVASRQKTAPVK